jgi:hypothetical protein
VSTTAPITGLPPVDLAQVTPAVADVALLCATRTIDSTTTQLGTFTADTNPTDVQCQALIAQAVTLALAPLPDYLQPSLYGRIREAAALQAAILVETSFYREQANAAALAAMIALLQAMQTSIQADAGGAGAASRRVDSIVVRSTMTDYDPYYPMPPPPAVGINAPAPPVVQGTG